MFEKYSNLMLELKSFGKEDILNEIFELYREDNLKIYYAPHNEIINEQAKVFIVGITPGWTQTSIAYQTAHKVLQNGIDFETIKKNVKEIIDLRGVWDKIRLNDKLVISSCSKLFEENDELLHTTSLIPYPVFINNKNYPGFNPKICDSKILSTYVRKYFYEEVTILKDVLIIPLGKAVEEVLSMMIEEDLLKEEQCLLGFPHPLGANGHRKIQFEQNKDKLVTIVEAYFRA